MKVLLSFHLNIKQCVSGELSRADLPLWGKDILSADCNYAAPNVQSTKKIKALPTSFLSQLSSFFMVATDVNRPFHYGCLMLLWQPA